MPGRRRGEEGQSTPLVMSVLFALTLFAAVVVDVGQAVNRRVALQIIADAGAFTGASVMATGLNQMAYWNKWMQRLWSVFTVPMTPAWYAGVDLLPCEATDAWEEGYGIVRDGLAVAVHAVAYVYTHYAYMEAKRVTTYNAVDLFPFEVVEGAESSLTSFEGGNIPLSRNQKFSPLVDFQQVPDGTWSNHWTGIATHSSTRFQAYACVSGKVIPHPEPRFSHYDVWYEKTPTARPAYFVWVVKAPRTKAFMFDGFFGGDVIPEMWAAAAARPVGGSIAEGDPSYVAKMVPLSEVLPGNRLPGGSFVPAGAIWDSVLKKLRLVTH
jgi:hypothetical protein